MNAQRASISFRIGVPNWQEDERYERLLALFERERGVADEITFFLSWTHAPIPLDLARARCEVLKARMARARALGYRAGINVLCTMGHHEENLPGGLQDGYTRVTDLEGRVSRGSLCLNGSALGEYVDALYTAVADARPDYIWVDDDVRLMGHGPVSETCFCEECLTRFARQVGREYTRGQLREALDAGTVEEKLALRKQWLEHNRAGIERLLARVERAVHARVPGLPLGFMTGERFYEGYAFARWAGALAGASDSPVLWRPGGGFYEDSQMGGLTEKADQVGRQNSLLPDSVRVIQSEIENFPYQMLKKGARLTALESCAHIAAGCTGAAYNVLNEYEPLSTYESFLRGLHAWRPFQDLLVDTLGRSPCEGVCTGWNIDAYAAVHLREGETWTRGDVDSQCGGFARELYALGVPHAYARSRVMLLSADAAWAMSDAQIEEILSGGVYMDAGALDALHERGYGALTGFASGRRLPHDCIEAYLPHELNTMGTRRDGRQSFYRTVAVELHAAHGAQPLCELRDYGDAQLAPCSMGIFENDRGGRVCVAGYFPWTFLQSPSKAEQVKRVLNWLSRGRLPAYVASYHRARLWARRAKNGALALVLLNTGYDVAEGIELCVRSDALGACYTDSAMRATALSCAQAPGGYRRLTLPSLAPWDMALLVLDQ